MHPYLTTHLVTTTVPAHLEDAASSLVRVHQLAVLGAPDVDTPEMMFQMENKLRNILKFSF